MKTKLFLLVFILTGIAAMAQRRPFHGKIIAGDAVVTNVFIINKYTGKETKSDGQGLFTLDARLGDHIVIYGTNIEVREFVANESTFIDEPYIMEVIPKGTELNEVVITAINPEKLGLVPKGQKQYTVAERRLKTASEFKPNLFFLLGGGISMPLDPIINAISGRTKMLKKNLETERKEFNIDRIDGIYTREQITTKLHIPDEMAQGFVFYAVEDAECAEALRTKNKTLAQLRLMLLAEKYLELQKEGAVTTPQEIQDTEEPPQPTTDEN